MPLECASPIPKGSLQQTRPVQVAFLPALELASRIQIGDAAWGPNGPGHRSNWAQLITNLQELAPSNLAQQLASSCSSFLLADVSPPRVPACVTVEASSAGLAHCQLCAVHNTTHSLPAPFRFDSLWHSIKIIT